MIDLAIAVAYGFGGLWVARVVFRNTAESARRSWPRTFGWDDVLFSVGFALFAGVLWPPIAAWLLLQAGVGESDPAAFVRKVGGESRDARLARQADEIREHQRHIAELERELRIGHPESNGSRVLP